MYSRFTNIYKIAFKKNIKIAEIMILAILCLIVYCMDLSSVGFQPDETFWISTSNRLDYLLNFDFSAKSWSISFYTYEVRPIPSYIVGIGQRLAGITIHDISLDSWDWSRSPEFNMDNNRMPSDKALYYSRFPMAIMAVFSLVLTTALIAIAHSRLAGYIFYCLCFNNYFILHLRRAMSESPLLFFTTLTMMFTYKLLMEIKRTQNTKSIFIWSILIGFSSGLAGQSKLNGLACGTFAIVASLVALYQHDLSDKSKLVSKLKIIFPSILLTTTISFIGSYPFFYKDTMQRIVDTLFARQAVLADQIRIYPSSVILPNQRINILLNRVFNNPFDLTSYNLFASIIILCITSFGVYHSIKHILKNKESDMFLILVTAMIFLGIPMLFIPLDWDRYYLYPIFFSCIFFSIGLAQLFSSVIRKEHHTRR